MANPNDSAFVCELLRVPQALQFVFFAANHGCIQDDANYWNLLGTLWKASGRVEHLSLWLPLFRSSRRKREKIMKSRERRRWRALPKIVTAYRAVNHPSEAETAISWTLDKRIAERVFSHGVRQVVSRQFKRDEVFALFDRRGEEEIIVNI